MRLIYFRHGWLVAALVCALTAAVGPASARAYDSERVMYDAPGGNELHATIYTPKEESDGPRPAIVVAHGGAWTIGTRFQHYWFCHRFAENGYVVMTIDYRMMPKYPFPNCLHDCKSAVRWLRLNAERFNVDPERIGAFGGSAGGHLALLLGTTMPEDGFEGTGNPGASSSVKAVISLYGVTDLGLIMQPRKGLLFKSARRPFIEEFVGKKSINGLSPVAAASPVSYVDNYTCPVLLVHGKGDSLVRPEHAIRFYEAMGQHNRSARMVLLPDRGHGFDHLHWFERPEIFVEMLSFFDRELKGVLDTCAEKQTNGGEI